MDRKLSDKTWIAPALLVVIIFLTYSNSFKASWHLDDFHNILNNPRIQLNKLQINSIYQTFYASHDGGLYLGKRLYRPITCLTLALNWYFGKDDVTGYHVVNLIIHYLTALILYFTVVNLLKAPNLNGRHRGSEHFIALLTAVFWAINPIQTQAVTYIIQRMASLSAMFYILSFFLYLKARLSHSLVNRILLLSGCMLGFLLAMGSKENAATLPIALMMLEILFFQKWKRPKLSKAVIWSIVALAFLAVLLSLFFFYQDRFSALMAGYNTRSFSAIQRLMTQPRIILFYLSQIFYPIPSRLSIEHDITVSTSLLNPWTTLPSILLVMTLIGLALSQMRKRPILSFAIIFFFLNHLIESSIIPLELIFEHRNYLPSLFVFLPVSAGIKWALDYFREEKRSMHVVIASSVCMLIIALGLGTYIRNTAWTTEKTLWQDAISKAPERARPYQNLGWGHYEKIQNLDEAYKLYEKALNRTSDQPVFTQILSLTNMAGILNRQGKYAEALELTRKALDIYPHYIPALRVMTMSLLNLKDWQAASKSAEALISKNYLRKDYRILYGFCLLKVRKYSEALDHFRDTLRMYPNDRKVLYNIGVTLNLLKYYERSEFFLNLAKQRSPNNILIFLYLIENRALTGDESGANRYLDQLFALHSIQKIKVVVSGISDNELLMTFSPDLVLPLIDKKIEENIREIEALGQPMPSDYLLGQKRSIE